MTDGFQGTLARARQAKKHLHEFLISTECGFGRRPPEEVPQLLKLHAEVAAALRAE
jgi:methionine synthase II (cobalamin-independent)